MVCIYLGPDNTTMTPAELRQALEASFPLDATSWRQATDEVPDMARMAREHRGICGGGVDFREIETPSEWNTRGIDSIVGHYEQMNDGARASYLQKIDGLY